MLIYLIFIFIHPIPSPFSALSFRNGVLLNTRDAISHDTISHEILP